MSSIVIPPEADRIRSYLLRRLPESERTHFEEAYFSDDSLLDRVEAEEDRLVSDYVLGRLDQTDRRKFEESLLGSQYYRERVATTSQLRLKLVKRVTRSPGRERRSISRQVVLGPRASLFPGRIGTVVAFGLLSVMLLAAFLSALRLRSELAAALNAPKASPATKTSAAAGATLFPATEPVILGMDMTPGPSLRHIVHTPGAPVLLVFNRALIPGGARSYGVRLLDERGKAVWTSGPVKVAAASAGDFAVTLPAGFPSGGRTAVILEVELAGRMLLANETVLQVSEAR